MKKVLVLAAALAAAASFIVVGTASADPSTDKIIRQDGVRWFDGAGNYMLMPDATAQVVITHEADGSYNVRANGTLPDGAVLPKKTQQYSSETDLTHFCANPGDSWKGVTTPSGQFHFSCTGVDF